MERRKTAGMKMEQLVGRRRLNRLINNSCFMYQISGMWQAKQTGSIVLFIVEPNIIQS